MAIQAVSCNVELAVSEPVDVQIISCVGDIFNLSEWFQPLERFCLIGPEGFRIFNRVIVKRLITFLVDPGAFGY